MTAKLLFCAAILWLAQSLDVTKPVQIQKVAGTNFSLTCVEENLTRLEPPPGCILNTRKCLINRGPLKYLSWSKSHIETYNDFYANGKFRLEYKKNATVGTLYAHFFDLSDDDSGLYRCGVNTSAGREFHQEYVITVTYGRFPPLPYDVTTAALETLTVRGTDKTNSSMELEKVVDVVGENVAVKCLLDKSLNVRKPPSDCIQDYSKCQSFFQPLLYLQRKGNPLPVLMTYEDNADDGRHSLSYGKSVLLVGIRGLTKADMGQYVCGVQAPSGDDASATFEIIVEDAVTEANGQRRLLLLLLIPALLLLMAGGLWLLIFYKKKNSNCDSPKADASGQINTEDVLYENCRAPASEPADSTYQTLSADTRDHNRIYSSLNTMSAPSSNIAPWCLASHTNTKTHS